MQITATINQMQLNSSQYNKKETVVVGLCFMKRKLQAKRNQQVYALLQCKEIQTVQLWPYFNQHWSKWPIVDVLFHSHTSKFPYIMVYQYVQKHKPVLINDIQNQQMLWDRTVTYGVLREINVPVPRYFPIYQHQNHLDRLEKQCYGRILNQNDQELSYEHYMANQKSPPGLFRKLYQIQKQKFKSENVTQTPDTLKIISGGKQIVIQRPFVQKPFNSNDHEVSLYYQAILGGGRRVLYRQNHGYTSSAESTYQKDQKTIRKEQNYVYEEFIGTNVFDIKVYAIGDFIFAESRRSPMVDVEKGLKNLQLRHQIELTVQEREYCQRIVRKFKFPICGLDILRSEGKSYVCDINGWAFAKAGGLKEQVTYYWQLVAKYLRNMVFEKFFAQKVVPMKYSSLKEYKKSYMLPELISLHDRRQPELVGLIGVLSLNGRNNNRLIQLGQKIRKNSYDDIDCLALYSNFGHSLRIETQTEQRNKIDAAYLLKGFLGIKGQLSPALVSMVKFSKEQKVLNTSECNLSKFQILLSKIHEDLERFKNNENLMSPRLKTYIYTENQTILQEMVRFLYNHATFINRNSEITERNNQSSQNQEIKRDKIIQLKLYWPFQKEKSTISIGQLHVKVNVKAASQNPTQTSTQKLINHSFCMGGLQLQNLLKQKIMAQNVQI